MKWYTCAISFGKRGMCDNTIDGHGKGPAVSMSYNVCSYSSLVKTKTHSSASSGNSKETKFEYNKLLFPVTTAFIVARPGVSCREQGRDTKTRLHNIKHTEWLSLA